MDGFEREPSFPVPEYGRMMAFIDGENLLCRFQDLKNNKRLRPDRNVRYEENLYVWHPETIKPNLNIVLRAYYYISIVGDDKKIREMQENIKNLTFRQSHMVEKFAKVPSTLYPKIFKKSKNTNRAKGVDIQMTVDILTHVHSNHLDVVYLVSGDGDFIPIVDEVIRSGKQIYIAAFSSGLNVDLKRKADRFIELDNIYFER